MNNIFRGLIAGYGAKKLGGGCFGTIIVFILIWVALGQCDGNALRTNAVPETYPSKGQFIVNSRQIAINAPVTIAFIP